MGAAILHKGQSHCGEEAQPFCARTRRVLRQFGLQLRVALEIVDGDPHAHDAPTVTPPRRARIRVR